MMKHYLRLVVLLLLVGSGQAFAQYTVTGTVKDGKTGEPIIGANVYLKENPTKGTLTDADGKFSLGVPTNQEATLEIKFLGYFLQAIPVSPSQTSVSVSLKEDITNLEEIVVSGLASSVKRSNLANAVTSVSAKELTGTTTIQTTDGALYGKVVGANIRSSGGAPGGGISIQLRGISSLVGASQPLIILDGVYINNASQRTGRATLTGAGASNQDDGANRLADINPADIENIEILKGPSAAAIYGTRANAGVVIITTKKGSSGKTKISFSQDIGFANPLRLLGVDDWSEAKINEFFPEARRAIELERYRKAVQTNTFIDYEDYFYNNKALLSNTRLSLTGGTDKTKFYISGNIADENGTIRNTGFERYSLRTNIDHKINSWLTLGVSSNYIKTNTDRGFTGNQNNSGASIGYSIAYVPNYFDLRANPDGSYPDNPYFAENPVALTDKATNNSTVNRFVQAFNLGIDIFKTEKSFLKASIVGGLDYVQNTTLIHMPEDLQYQRAQANPGDVLWGKQESTNTNFQASLVYNWNVGNVNFNSSGGIVRLDFKDNVLFNRSRGLTPGQINLSQGTVQSIDQQFFQNVQEAGLFLQQEANYLDKVIGTVGIRWDKSSLNADHTQFYAFPRASLAVNLAKFGDWGGRTINLLKPRIAYGETAGPVSFGATFTSLGGANIGGLLGSVVGNTIGNNAIRPESASELEMGIDAGLFDSRVLLEASYYIKNTKNNLQNLSLSPSTGVTSISSNEAELQNKGIELSLSGTPVELTNIKWNTRIMYWQNRVKMTKLGIPTYIAGAFGSSLGTFLYSEGYSPTTIVGTPAVPNSPSTGNFTVLGNSLPKFTMSWSNNLNIYKNLDFSFLFEWKKGGDNINLSHYLLNGGGTAVGWMDDKNGNGVIDAREPTTASAWVQDASYVKLREIGLYYTLPKSFTSSILNGSIEKIRIGSSVNNALLFTKYNGYDPETSTFGAQSVANNVDINPYPTQRRVFFHLTLDF
ncbi:TonB-dependent receptor plug [Leadbetterella byssophila DSM 17132]|uniref:TonB-dependent receptor plug n=1 Tax=Leadbetterella byssophila (strain DSM 17132 / JCM 16389 / KACC 11308 / NBRC 106382 / 4M15) TaxID=649349 RepID=E4RZP7_LEAB4|nr:TonB-dependent receptor plug [Leadbetterella byssophila DSM 17132]